MSGEVKKINKKVIGWCAVGAVCIILAAGGYYMGWSTRENAARAKEAVMEKQSETIAVVNMDAGVIVDEENINYATKLMSSLGEEYVLTNIQDAQNGINQDKYAAYLIIPSDFSESVVSLNTTPQKAIIEYALNSKLNSEDSVKAIKNVETFNQMLNSGMSYMYISSILSEIHSVQDGAATIMDNDQKDTEVILSITPYDLTSMVQLPDLSHVDNSVEPLNVESYIDQNAKDVDSIGERYTYYISLSEADWQLLSEEGNNLTAEWAVMEETINNVDVTKDEFGANVIESGLESTKAKLDAYTAALDTKETEIQTRLETIKQNIENRNKELEAVIIEYNQNRGASLNSTARAVLERLQAGPEISITGSGSSMKVGNMTVDVPYIQKPDITNARGIVFQNYINTVDRLIADSSDTNLQTVYSEYINSDPTGELENLGMSMSEFIRMAEGNLMIQSGIDITALSENLSRAVNGTAEGNLPAIGEMQNILNTGIPIFEDILNRGTVDETTVRDQLQKESEDIGTDLENSITKTIPRLPAEEFETQINRGIISPLTVNTDRLKSGLLAQYQIEKMTLNTYMKSLNSYNPLGYIDQNEIQSYVANMRQTGSMLQADLSEDYSSNMEYVSDVTSNAEKNVASLAESVSQADEASNKAVTDGLAKAQGAKARTLETNQALLQDFTKKLPYTRLGNLEYTNAYQFISDPTELTVKADAKEAKDKETSETSKEVRRGAQEAVILLFILMGMVILIVLLRSLLSERKLKTRRNQMTYIS